MKEHTSVIFTPGESLSFDHAFKVASNVGSLRADKKWACEYDSAFIMFNGNEKIVLWQYTKGTSCTSLAKQHQKKKHNNRDMYNQNCTLTTAVIGGTKFRMCLVM